MTEIRHIITDELGIHARPAALFVKQCAAYQSSIMVGTEAKMVDAKRIMGVMGLALKCGDEMIMTFEGADAEQAAQEMAAFLKQNL